MITPYIQGRCSNDSRYKGAAKCRKRALQPEINGGVLHCQGISANKQAQMTMVAWCRSELVVKKLVGAGGSDRVPDSQTMQTLHGHIEHCI